MCVVEEYINSCYIKKCFGGGKSCYIALSEDAVALLNLVLNFSIKSIGE
jgi:hypothetical protein